MQSLSKMRPSGPKTKPDSRLKAGDTVPTSAVVLRAVLQKGRNVALKRANPRKGRFKEEIGRRRGPGRKGGGEVNLPPYKWLIHADRSANLPPKTVQYTAMGRRLSKIR